MLALALAQSQEQEGSRTQEAELAHASEVVVVGRVVDLEDTLEVARIALEAVLEVD